MQGRTWGLPLALFFRSGSRHNRVNLINADIKGFSNPPNRLPLLAILSNAVLRAKCLVHILNRPFQDQRPILHVDSFNASFLVLSASVSRNEPTTSNKYSDL